MTAPFLFCSNPVPLDVLKHSDVVTMYQGSAETYANYGIDVLAWGGNPTTDALKAIGNGRFFGSVGMVTEFRRYHEFAGTQWEEGLCRDAQGDPVKIPWLLDLQHKGIPYYFCCTNQPVFRAYIRHRIEQTLEAGAMGLHIDDHLGTAGSVYHGGCFCTNCLQLFGDYVSRLNRGQLKELGAADWSSKIDYQSVVSEWRKNRDAGEAVSEESPFHRLWESFHINAAREFMLEIRSLVMSLKDKPIPVSANACILFHPHSTDYDALDYFSAEIDQEAKTGEMSDLPVVAYRLAEALGRPVAATASGSDWAFILSSGSDRLVRNWVAQAYAAGQFFMAPHRQWCHTPEKGTHWYDGPSELFAPLFQFIKRNEDRLDPFETLADVVVLFDMKLYRDSDQLKELSQKLSENGICYQYAIIEDTDLDFDLDRELLTGARSIIVPKGTRLNPKVQKILDRKISGGTPVYRSIQQALIGIQPMVSLMNDSDNRNYRIFLRQSDQSEVIHVVKRSPESPTKGKLLQLDLSQMNLGKSVRINVFDYSGGVPEKIKMKNGSIEFPAPELWTIIEIEK